jgi:hypothetical protein
MKRLTSLLLVVFVLLGGAYGGLWYYGCMQLDERLAKKDFSFAFGPDKDVAMTVKIDRGPSRYTGWQRGELGVEFDVKSVSSTSSVKMPQQAPPQLSSATVTSGEKPWVTRVSVPLWGSSLKFDVAPFKEARYETKIADNSYVFLQSADAYRMTVEFRDAQIALSREKQIDAMIADPKRIFEDVAGFDLVTKAQTLDAETKKVLVEGAINGGGLHWTIGSDGMLNVRYDADSEIKYGPAFFDFIGAQAVVPAGMSPDVTQRFDGFMKIQQALMSGSSFISKGAVQVTLPANRVGLRESAAASDTGFPVAPFEVKFDRFKFRLPFVWSRLTVVDGTVGFMWNGAKPIAVNLTQESDALDVQPAVDEIMKVALDTPEFQKRGLDTARVTPSSLVSFKEVESDQGAFVLVQSSVRALSSVFFSQKASSALKVDVKTSSGNANVFELMGASAAWTARAKLGNGFGAELEGSADGAKSWKTTITIYELVQLLRELKAPLTLFGVRAGLSTFFQSAGDSGITNEPVNPKEKELLAFFFSDELFEDLLAALGRVLRVVDQTPDSTNELKLLLEGRGADLSINGKRAEELQQALMPVVMQEVQALQSKFEPRLSTLRLVAEQAELAQESVEQGGGEDVQWQEAPTEEGEPSEEIAEE